jgi:hypothetical protein
MELNQLITLALDELSLAKNHEQKSKYLIEDIELTINVATSSKSNNIIDFKIVKFGDNANQSNTHQIKVKLKPKTTKTNSKLK